MKNKTACKKCGGPLKKGNVKVVRPRGKKRPYRIHRKCPTYIQIGPLKNENAVALLEGAWELDRQIFGTAGNPVQRPQDTTGGPVTVEGVLDYSPPPRFRYFMTQEQAERVRATVERNVAFGLGVAFEVFPVPEDQVENEPDRFDDLVEVKVNWKVE